MQLKAFLGSCSPRSIPRSASDSSGPSAPSSNELGSETATGGVYPRAPRMGRLRGERAESDGGSDAATSVRIVTRMCSSTPCQRSSPCPQDADRDDECREATQRRDVLERGVHRVALGVVQRQPRRPQRVGLAACRTWARQTRAEATWHLCERRPVSLCREGRGDRNGDCILAISR